MRAEAGQGQERSSKEDPEGPTSAPPALAVIGRPQRKLDGLAKSTGRAIYTDDITLPGRLAHGKILRSPHPHARILGIDTTAAEALPGVFGVVIGREMPTPYGIIPWTPDEQALCTDRVRYIGDAVAAVAALDEETANAALALIRVEYELLPAILDPEQALTPEAAATPIHAAKGETSDGRPKNGNISKVVKLEFGEVERGLAESDVVVEGEYFFEGTTHAPIEPHCAIGLWEEGGAGVGRLTVWSSTQVPHYLHRELSQGAGAGRGAHPRHPAAGRRRLRRQVASPSTSSSAPPSWR